MGNEIFRDKFRIQVQSALAEAKSAARSEHNGLAGKIREILVDKILRPAIDPRVRIGTGKIVDSFGNLSREMDIVLYCPEILPPVLHDEKTGFFPIESCLYSIEVKSTLTAGELKDAYTKALSLEPLVPAPGSFPATVKVVSALFAFGSDLSGTGKTEIDRYHEYEDFAYGRPLLSAICVVGKGYWFDRNSENNWGYANADDSTEEVLGFIAGVANTVPQIIAKKDRPAFGYYLLKNDRLAVVARPSNKPLHQTCAPVD